MTSAAADILEVMHLSMRFGGIVAINDLSFSVKRGDITALIGPNGAGKTTVFNCITGFYKPTTGMLRLTHGDGREFLLERLFDYRVSKNAKVARTFQNIRLFAGMTALENLMVAQHNPLMRASGYTLLGLIGAPGFRNAENDAIEIGAALAFAGLRGIRAHAQILGDAHARKDAAALRGLRDAQMRDAMGRCMCDVLSVETDFAGARTRPAEHRHHQGRFAGAVGADQRHDLAGSDIEVDALERLDVTIGGAQAADGEQWMRRRAHASSSITAMAASSSAPR